ncbi:probable cysteine desulfurase [Macadamia integrifolia]|uniref:probable cysteine desulfurase n=1 Tax=Macadamia integrifolia TaxID=60698 RepID=UPI001C501DAA|nr:probable cysteine desulfurase [Macadamia integrifolia]
MEFEQTMVGKTYWHPKTEVVHHPHHDKHPFMRTSSSIRSSNIPDFDDHHIHRSESFGMLDVGVTKTDPAETKFEWLRSQLIGHDVEFDTPFGKRLLTYADHTASGRGLHIIEAFISNNVLPFYGNTHTSDSYVGHKTTKMVKEATRYIKNCLGTGPDDALIFPGSGTTAAIKRLQEVMGITVPSTMRERILKSLKSEERWVVFVGPYEHHSNLLSWRNSLAEVIEIGLDNDGLLDMRALSRQLELYKDSNRPMLGSFSACSNVTGIYSDTRAIARLLHQHGAFACFDYAASGPYVEIDMRSGELEGYDAVFMSPHKFLGGPGTPGLLLMNKALYKLRSSAPSTCGGGTVDFVNGFSEEHTLYYEDVEEREDAGTPPIVQKIRAALAFWVKDFIGYNVIENQEHVYINAALKRLLPNPNISVLGNTSVVRQAILSFVIFSGTNSSSYYNGGDRKGLYMWEESGNKKDKPLHGPFVAKLLNDLFGIQARAGCACAAPYGHHLLGVDENRSLAFRSAIEKGYTGVKPGWTRLSFPYYMSKEEFEFILAALEFIAAYGQRFLPLYSFNWKTGNWAFKSRAFMENILGEDYTLDPVEFSRSEAKPGMKIISINGTRNGGDDDDDDLDEKATNIGVIRKYTHYLETAKYAASFLPKFPPQRKIPKEIDPSLAYFRV